MRQVHTGIRSIRLCLLGVDDDYPYRDPLNIDFKTVAYEKIKQSEDFIDGTDV